MKNDFSITELSFVIVGRNHNPTILNPDFLKYNNIVPVDWELAKPPICLEPMAEVAFGNSVKINAQLDRVIFCETLVSDVVKDIHIDDIATKYVETLPHVQYLAVGLNFKGHVPYEGQPKGPQTFLFDKIIAKGPWQEYGRDRKASISFNFFIDDCAFNLTVKEGGFKISDTEHIPALLFGSNIHHELLGDMPKQKLESLKSIVGNWKSDLRKCRDLVETIFLNSEG